MLDATLVHDMEFLITSLVVVLIPGTGVVYTVSGSVGGGRLAVFAAKLAFCQRTRATSLRPIRCRARVAPLPAGGDTEARPAGRSTKGPARKMKITDADHTNWWVRDVERSLAFYRDVLGLEPFGLEAYERGEHPLVSLRVTPEFILHLRPDPTFKPASTGGYDHLALVVEDTNPDALAEYLEAAGVEIENRSDNVIGARGSGQALYVRDPDGYLIELKFYNA
jgi:catechol 2,3-dioxygenase-like lactoylglutathione lyase family enzyme